MEHHDTERPFSKAQERHLQRLARKLFMEHHPNPDRIGCPDDETLKAVAHSKGNLSGTQREAVMDHLSICSPCFREFYGYRRGDRFRRQAPIFLGMAAVVIVAGLLAYDYFGPQSTGSPGDQQIAREGPIAPIDQLVTIDLRGHSPIRGDSPGDPTAEVPDVAFPRGRLGVTLLLPVGSEEGNYSIRLGPSGEPAVVTASGRAEIRDGTMALECRMDTSDLEPDNYVLGVREEPWAWTEYVVEVR